MPLHRQLLVIEEQMNYQVLLDRETAVIDEYRLLPNAVVVVVVIETIELQPVDLIF